MNGLRPAAPADLDALKALLASFRGPVHFIAGGTDVLIASRPLPTTGLLIDISQTAGLSCVEVADESLRIGATTSLATLAVHPLLGAVFAALQQAAEQCGSVQIRNRATIGGNIAGASPAGDLLPVLKCADARFRVLRADGSERILVFDELVLGAGRTSLVNGEFIIDILVPLSGLLPRSGFVKLGRRDDMTISRLNLTMQAEYREDERRFAGVCLVAGAIGPVPLRLQAVEDGLCGRDLIAKTVRSMLDALVRAVDEAIPTRQSRGYKRRAIQGLGLDLLAKITGVAQTDPVFEECLS